MQEEHTGMNPMRPVPWDIISVCWVMMWDITFFRRLRQYGKDFQQCLGSMETHLLLSPYRFAREGEGGYINQGFNMIRYNPDFTITTEPLGN